MKVWVLVAAVGVLAGHAAAKPADPALSDELKRLTQAFSDAGLNGDRAAFERLADADFVMTNEDGSVVTKAELLEGAKGQKRTGQTLTVTDFVARVQGEVATVTFVDELKQTIAGQALDYRFRSTETWMKKAAGWRMISSQSITLLEDPKAIALSVTDLGVYVGLYRLAPGIEIEITLKDGDLVAARAGGKPAIWKAEARDVFFTPGEPRARNVFQRDTDGRIIGFASRREGRDLVLSRVS